MTISYDLRVPRSGPNSSSLKGRFLSPEEIGPIEISRWRDLSRRTVHRNPFQLPEFVIPTWRHLNPAGQQALAIVVDETTSQWLAAVALSFNQSSNIFRWPHTSALHERHSFRTGPLVDEVRMPAAIDGLLRLLAEHPAAPQNVEFPLLRLDSILARGLEASARRHGFGWHVHDTYECPAVFPEIVSTEYLEKSWSASRRKTIRRARKKLEAFGPVQFRIWREPDDVHRALGKFLELEHRSWKGAGGTSIVSTPQDLSFVQEMVAGLAEQGHVLMTELLAGERVAASAINLTLGETLCAFKIGWDLDLAEASPGLVHEVELLETATGPLCGFTLFDGCSFAESYLGPLWPERIPIGNVTITLSLISKASRALVDAGRLLKNLSVPTRPVN